MKMVIFLKVLFILWLLLLYGCLKRSVPIVVKAVPETSGSGNFIAENLIDIISKLARIGFNVRDTVCDDHSSNVNAYSKLSQSYGKDGTYYIHHLSYEGMLSAGRFLVSLT